MMTVGELKKLLDQFTDETFVLVNGYEGGLCTPLKPELTKVIKFGYDDQSWYGAHSKSLNDNSETVDAIVLHRTSGHKHDGIDPDEYLSEQNNESNYDAEFPKFQLTEGEIKLNKLRFELLVIRERDENRGLINDEFTNPQKYLDEYKGS